MQEQAFAGVLYMEAAKKFSACQELRRELIAKEMEKATEYQKEAFVWFLNQVPQTKEAINEARIRGLDPLDRLHPSNVTKKGKARKVRANQERILNVLGCTGSPYNPPNRGGSVRKALKGLEARRLATCVPHKNGRDVSWIAGSDLRNWIEAGGFIR